MVSERRFLKIYLEKADKGVSIINLEIIIWTIFVEDQKLLLCAEYQSSVAYGFREQDLSIS